MIHASQPHSHRTVNFLVIPVRFFGTFFVLVLFFLFFGLSVTSQALAAEREAGDLLELRLNGVTWRFHWCPTGSFMMGSPSNEKGRQDDETQHKVTLTQGFWMGEMEVPQSQWQAVMYSVMSSNPSRNKADYLPVECVSWNDCQEFVKQLNKALIITRTDTAVAGYHFALPTEAQWEYACRAGSTTAYCFGDDDSALSDYAWYYDGWDFTIEGERASHPVGAKKANAWGLYDMHGNVFEWCQDWYGDYSAEAVVDPAGAVSGSERVYRGGHWSADLVNCRSACRAFHVKPERRLYNVGLRVCLVPGEPTDE